MNKTTKEKIRKHIASQRDKLTHISLEIYKNPELGYKEFKASEMQKEILTSMDFKVSNPFINLPTAFKATYGEKGPCFMFISEYDALPELGHGCGHNLISAASIAAAYAVRKMLEDTGTPGTIMVAGTPAEEGAGGKVLMIRERAFLRVDAAMMAHPAGVTMCDTGSLSVRRYDVMFHGVSAHAAAAPTLGRNSLDGINLLFAGVNAWRQYIPEASRVHGIITDGGKMPNIIPDYAEARFYLRGETEKITNEMEKRFKDIVKGAALMSGTKYRIQDEDTPYRSTKLNAPLNDMFMEFAEAEGMNPQRPNQTGRSSTDFGNLSQVLPGAHVCYKICDADIPWHSVDFRKAAGTERALEETFRVANVLAQVAWEFFTNETFRKSVKKTFDAMGDNA